MFPQKNVVAYLKGGSARSPFLLYPSRSLTPLGSMFAVANRYAILVCIVVSCFVSYFGFHCPSDELSGHYGLLASTGSYMEQP